MEINVSWCDLITENGVEALARGCNKLKRFSSKGCKQVNNNAVICLATYCKSLEVLNLHSCDVSVVHSCVHVFRRVRIYFSVSVAICNSEKKEMLITCWEFLCPIHRPSPICPFRKLPKRVYIYKSCAYQNVLCSPITHWFRWRNTIHIWILLKWPAAINSLIWAFRRWGRYDKSMTR